jgi:hypothetical protein
MTDPVAEARERQQRHHQHELVDRDDVGHRGVADPEVARDRRQRDVGDRPSSTSSAVPKLIAAMAQ